MLLPKPYNWNELKGASSHFLLSRTEGHLRLMKQGCANNSLRLKIWQQHKAYLLIPQCLKQLVFLKGMQVRLTKNLDKDRVFVNGALGTIVKVLNKQTFVVETEDYVHLLAQLVCDNAQPFVPAAHGYAMTIRRGQGSTLELAALHSDRRTADRGYGCRCVAGETQA